MQLPDGFKLSGVRCGIKIKGKDIALICSDIPATAAGVFTRNRLKANSLIYTKRILRNNISAVVINSGNANCSNGKQGLLDAEKMASLTGELLNIKRESVAVASTGIIGVPLQMNKIRKGIKLAVKNLRDEGVYDAATSIMTTDTIPKITSSSFKIGDKSISILGIAKGSGMIAPDMATMLAFFLTDLNIKKCLLKMAIKNSVNKSFNMTTVDADTSPSDLVLILANGKAGNKKIDKFNGNFKKFQNALDDVSISLAKLIARDGEGSTKFIEVNVKGANSFDTAKKVAKSIANSNLVKTAIFGGDPNWGRILSAIGYSKADLDINRIDIYLGNLKVCENGNYLKFSKSNLRRRLSKKEVSINVDLKQGRESATVWTCDLSYDYVRINAEYHT